MSQTVRYVELHNGKKMTQGAFLDKLKASILAEPEKYVQSNVCEANKPTCQSPACIAGWMAHFLFNNMLSHYEDCHEAVFGTKKWPWLFNSNFYGGPGTIVKAFNKALTPKAQAKVACIAIDRYLADWLKKKAA